MASAGAGLVVSSGLGYRGMNDVPAESCIVLGVLTLEETWIEYFLNKHQVYRVVS